MALDANTSLPRDLARHKLHMARVRECPQDRDSTTPHESLVRGI